MLQIKHLGRRTNQPHKANLPKSFICPTHGKPLLNSTQTETKMTEKMGYSYNMGFANMVAEGSSNEHLVLY